MSKPTRDVRAIERDWRKHVIESAIAALQRGLQYAPDQRESTFEAWADAHRQIELALESLAQDTISNGGKKK